MAHTYDTRPNLEGYDALTVRGIAKFAALGALLFGADFLARKYSVERWVLAAVQLLWISLGVRVLWLGCKTLITGKRLPIEAFAPRYSEPDRIEFISPRGAALIEVVFGVGLIAITIARLTQILSE